MAQRLTYMDLHMAEVIVCGGLLANRHQVYFLVLAETGDKRAADYFAHKPQPASPEQLAVLPWWKDHQDLWPEGFNPAHFGG